MMMIPGSCPSASPLNAFLSIRRPHGAYLVGRERHVFVTVRGTQRLRQLTALPPYTGPRAHRFR